MDPKSIHELSSAGRHQECLQACQQLLQSETENPLPWKYAGKSLLALGQLEKAQQCLIKAHQLDTTDPETAKDIGNIYIKLGSTDAATEWYIKSVKINNNYAPAINNIANIKRQSGKNQEAVDLFKRAIQADPQLVHAYIGAAASLLTLGVLDQAESFATQAIEINSSLPGVNEILGIIFQNQKNFQQAVESYQKELAINPQSSTSLLNLGLLLLQQGKPEAAIKPLSRVAGINPSEQCSLLLAQAYQSIGNLKEAISEYQRIDLSKTQNKIIPFNLGLCFLNIGNNIDAIEALKIAIQLDESFLPAWGNMGNALMNEGRHHEALSAAQKVLELNPNNPNAHMNLGSIYKELGNLDQALASTFKSLELEPNNANTLANLGVLNLTKKKISQAISYLSHALSLDPKNAVAHAAQGEIYWLNGDLDEAEKELSLATKLNPKTASYHRTLCHLLCAKGEIERAKKSYEDALCLEKSSNENKLTSLVLKQKSNRMATSRASHFDKYDCNDKSIVFPIILKRDVEPTLLRSLYNINARDLNEMSEPTFGKARGSDYNFFIDNKKETEKLEADLVSLIKTELNSDIYFHESFYTIISGSSIVRKHCHLSRLDKAKGLDLYKRKFALVYYLEVGDQNCHDPGILKLYDPDEDISPYKGMILIIPANRYHSVNYSGNKDRVIVGVNFYCL